MAGFLNRVWPSRGHKPLANGSRVAVIGGGPGGSLFSYFLLKACQERGRDVQVDIYEPRNFALPGPAGCNNCGGVISGTVVQALAAEGITLPESVVQRRIDSYVLHTDVGAIRLESPTHEKQIALVHRGAGPLWLTGHKWQGVDEFLLEQALSRGAWRFPWRVEAVRRWGTSFQLQSHGAWSGRYDLLVVAAGLNAATLRLFEHLGDGYRPPKTTRTFICEFPLADEALSRRLGDAMHVFLLNIPRLKFAALVPKGDCVTLCLLGREIDRALVQRFIDHPEVRKCLPADWTPPERCCHCSPLISVGGARRFFADGLVFVGDSAFSRLYKDGIGAALRTARAAADTAVSEGISAADFRRHYRPVCRRIDADNRFGRLIFTMTSYIKRHHHDQRGMFRMVHREQAGGAVAPRMSTVLWDTFTGGAPYRNVFLRTLHPAFLASFCLQSLLGLRAAGEEKPVGEQEPSAAGTGSIPLPVRHYD